MLDILTCSKTISTWGRTRLFWGRNQLPSPSTDCINFLKPAYSKKQPRFLWKQPGNSLYRVFSKYTAHVVTVTYFVLSVSSRPAKDLALLSKVNVIDAHDECSEHRALPVLLVNWPLLGLYHVYHRSHCRGYLGVPRWIPGNPKACLPWKSIGAFNISELKKCQLVDE